MSSSPLSPTSASKPDESVELLPPRFWWLKRIGIGVAMLLLVVIALRVWWGAVAQRRFLAEIESIRAAGEPLFPEDFDPSEVPDAQNAALLWRQAAALAVTATERDVLDVVGPDPTLYAARAKDFALLVQNHEAELAAARRARSLPGLDWGIRIRSPAVAFVIPPLSADRTLAKLLCCTAVHQHHLGDHVAAVESLRDVLAHADDLDAQPILIAHLVAIAMRELAVQTIEDLAPRLGRAGAADDRDAIRALLGDLLNERGFQDGRVTAYSGERMFVLDNVSRLVDGDFSLGFVAAGIGPGAKPALHERALMLLIRPMVELDGVHVLRSVSRWTDVARQPTYPSALARMPPDPRAEAGLRRITSTFSRILLPSLGSAVQIDFRHLARRRMAAAALAIRLYELDHSRRPATLHELVPEYLSALPIDPYAADGSPVGYRPDGAPSILYCIGLNGTDDGGAFAVGKDGTIERHRLDIPFFLSGDRPRARRVPPTATATSTQAHDDDTDIQTQQGDRDEQEQPQTQP